MRGWLALLITVALASCGPTQVENGELVGAPTAIVYPLASCPGGADEATWCLLFSDHSTAAIAVTQATPKAFGYLELDNYKIPVEGDITDGTISLHTKIMGAWGPEATIVATFGASQTFATAKINFFAVDEQFTMYSPDSFPTEVTTDPLQSVTGDWVWYPEVSTYVTSFRVVQRGRLLLAFVDYVSFMAEPTTVWPGERNGVRGFSFPKPAPIFDAGSWMSGEFSDDLTSATVQLCTDNIAGATCEAYLWRRR